MKRTDHRSCVRVGTALLAAACLFVTGCSTSVVPTSVGGSKADGTVVVRGSYGLWKSGEIDWDEALANARQTCIGWGYADARAFGEVLWRCTAQTPVGCANTEVVTSFQCTDMTLRRSSSSLPRGGGGMQCQTDSDCSAGQSCRSRKGGGTECRAITMQ